MGFISYLIADNQLIMSVLKTTKSPSSKFWSLFPEALLTHLSATTKVDYYSKVLHGKKNVLLLFCIFDNEKLSQRTLEDTFNSSGFKALFGLGEEEKNYAEVPSLKGFPKSIPIILKKFTSRCTEGFLNFIRRPKSKSTT